MCRFETIALRMEKTELDKRYEWHGRRTMFSRSEKNKPQVESSGVSNDHGFNNQSTTMIAIADKRDAA